MTVVALVAFGGAVVNAQTAKIVSRPLSPEEITEHQLTNFVAQPQVSGGNFTVGVGAPAYLDAMVPKGLAVTNVVWALPTKPGGATANLVDNPYAAVLPIYAPSDEETFDLVGRKMLLPDAAGQYTVTLTANNATNGAVISVTILVTASTYVGVGTQVSGQGPTFPQCGGCHNGTLRPDRVTGWAQTGHATMFTEAIDGLKSSHYGSGCIECHTLGFDTASTATNGGFDDVATQLSWTFPTVLTNGNWAALPDQLKQLSNIQCESCHGPGDAHARGFGNKTMTSVTLESGNCAQCHDEGTHHVKNREWEQSRHAIAVEESGSSCAGCHQGWGFIDRMDGVSPVRTQYAAIGCAVCHDPHGADNAHQVRSVADVVLNNKTEAANMGATNGLGSVIAQGGTGKLCMQCHISRRDAITYVQTSNPSAHFGPHHGPQTDMLAGLNGVTYGKAIPSSSHLTAIADSCVTCHIQETGANDPAFLQAGGHTFQPAWDGGTPNDPSDDVHLVGSCVGCHGPITSFDMARHDYDGDGVMEGVQTEVEGLLHDLAMLLPPIGQPTVDPTAMTSLAEKQGVYNYLFVEEDGSKGVHNTAYAVGLLKASIASLTGADLDADKDGLLDSWEVANFGDIQTATGAGDDDSDGASNALELAMGTNPKLADSDNDGFNDFAEIQTGNDPLNDQDNPNLAIRLYKATEFEFPTQVGMTYQVQEVSVINGGWTTLETIVGDGAAKARLLSTRGPVQKYFRVISSPTQP